MRQNIHKKLQEEAEIKHCLICGNATKWNKQNKSYRNYCSRTCQRKSLSSKELVEKRNNTFKERYGVSSFALLPNVQDKIKQTNIKRYGVNNVRKSEIIKDKITKTFIKKYKVSRPAKNKKILNKIKKTNLKKYNCAVPFLRPGVMKITLEQRRIKFYQSLFNSNRLQQLVEPLFSLDAFTNVQDKYKFKCIKCNKEFEDNLEDGKIPRCLNCKPLFVGSHYENEIVEYLKSIGIENIVIHDREQINPLELDIYLYDKKIAIEFNGLYWHSQLQGKSVNYHLDKTNLCNSKGIRLIHIFEDEWVNKQDIVKSRLKHILGLAEKSIFARKCIIKKIESKDKDIFLELNHIQGKDISKIRYGAFYENNLVAIMTFTQGRGSSKIKKIENEYELSRFATSCNIVGIASKLLQTFINEYKPIKISTYADIRWSKGNLYEKLGMKKISQTNPNYFYFKNGKIERIHRFNFRKNILKDKLEIFDENLTEWENMQLNDYDRIFDCGNYKYEIVLNG